MHLLRDRMMAKKLRKNRIKTTNIALKEINTNNLEKYVGYFLAAWNTDCTNDHAIMIGEHKEIRPAAIFKITGVGDSWYNIQAICGEATTDTYIKDTLSYMNRLWLVTNDKKLVRHIAEEQDLKYY